MRLEQAAVAKEARILTYRISVASVESSLKVPVRVRSRVLQGYVWRRVVKDVFHGLGFRGGFEVLVF